MDCRTHAALLQGAQPVQRTVPVMPRISTAGDLRQVVG